jgi:hypothetical protein
VKTAVKGEEAELEAKAGETQASNSENSSGSNSSSAPSAPLAYGREFFLRSSDQQGEQEGEEMGEGEGEGGEEVSHSRPVEGGRRISAQVSTAWLSFGRCLSFNLQIEIC